MVRLALVYESLVGSFGLFDELLQLVFGEPHPLTVIVVVVFESNALVPQFYFKTSSFFGGQGSLAGSNRVGLHENTGFSGTQTELL